MPFFSLFFQIVLCTGNRTQATRKQRTETTSRIPTWCFRMLYFANLIEKVQRFSLFQIIISNTQHAFSLTDTFKARTNTHKRTHGIRTLWMRFLFFFHLLLIYIAWFVYAQCINKSYSLFLCTASWMAIEATCARWSLYYI